MSTETANPEGQRLANNRYHVLKKLGEGGMATVYKARDENLEADVVIKIPKAALLADPEYSKRFTREIRALVKLNHPHIVKVLDVGEQDGTPYVVMQYLTGGSLQDQVTTAKDGAARSSGPLAALTSWLDKVANALDFIHKEGYVHRDVKPANILFDGHGNAYLSDFGIAKVLASDQDMKQSVSLTGTGVVLGTPAYMGPEFVMGLPYDGRIDQYALAVTVFEILAGRTPFEATTPGAMLVKQTTEAPRPLSEVVPGVSLELSLAVQKGLAKEPAQRFPSCAAFAEAVLRGYGNARTLAPRISSGMRPTDAPVSQQTVPHGPGGSSKQVPVPRFTPAKPTGVPTPVRLTAATGTRVSGPQTLKPMPLTRVQKPGSKAPLIIGAVVVLAAVAGGAFFFLRGDEGKGSSTVAPGKSDIASKEGNKGTPAPAVPPTPPDKDQLNSGELRHFAGHTNTVRCLGVSPDGRRMLSGSLDHTVRVWDVDSGKDLAVIKMEPATDTPLAVAFLPGDPNRVLIGGSQSVFIYDLDSKRVSSTLKIPTADAIAFFADGRRFCLGTDRGIEIWDLGKGERITRLSDDVIPQVRSLFVSQDSRFIVSGHGRGNGGANSIPDFSVVLWDAGTGRKQKVFDGHEEDVTTVTLSADAKQVLSASLDGSIRLWDATKGGQLQQYVFPRGVVTKIEKGEGGKNAMLRSGVAFSPDSKRAVMGAAGSLSYQDVIDLRELRVLKGHKSEMIDCVAFMPDGWKAFSAGGDKIVRLWSLRN